MCCQNELRPDSGLLCQYDANGKWYHWYYCACSQLIFSLCLQLSQTSLTTTARQFSQIEFERKMQFVFYGEETQILLYLNWKRDF